MRGRIWRETSKTKDHLRGSMETQYSRSFIKSIDMKGYKGNPLIVQEADPQPLLSPNESSK